MNIVRIAAATIAVLTLTTTVEARRGSCDGIHRCTCGSTQTRHFGLPRIYNGYNLWQAKEWARAFPRSGLHAGTVAVWPHHVARIVQPLNNGNAIVADEKGTYERRISGAVIVDPNGNGVSPIQAASTTRSFSAKHKHRRIQSQPEFVPVDRLMIH